MRLYLDDLRVTGARTANPASFDAHAFNAGEAIAMLETGNVTHISLDHDLNAEGELDAGVTGTGYDVAAWIEARAHAGTLPRLTWEVHSMNPAGAARIRAALESADRFWTALDNG